VAGDQATITSSGDCTAAVLVRCEQGSAGDEAELCCPENVGQSLLWQSCLLLPEAQRQNGRSQLAGLASVLEEQCVCRRGGGMAGVMCSNDLGDSHQLCECAAVVALQAAALLLKNCNVHFVQVVQDHYIALHINLCCFAVLLGHLLA